MRSSPIPSCLFGLLSLTLAASATAAVQASVQITAPANGAKLDAMEPARLVYQVTAGPSGDHVHVYVDDKEAGILRQLAGSYTLETLGTGPHTICIKVVNKAHVPIGVEKCIKVSVE